MTSGNRNDYIIATVRRDLMQWAVKHAGGRSAGSHDRDTLEEKAKISGDRAAMIWDLAYAETRRQMEIKAREDE